MTRLVVGGAGGGFLVVGGVFAAVTVVFGAVVGGVVTGAVVEGTVRTGPTYRLPAFIGVPTTYTDMPLYTSV